MLPVGMPVLAVSSALVSRSCSGVSQTRSTSIDVDLVFAVGDDKGGAGEGHFDALGALVGLGSPAAVGDPDGRRNVRASGAGIKRCHGHAPV